MKIQFSVSIASSVWGAYGVGDVGDVPDDEAQRLIAAGYASPVGGGKRETKETIPNETAARVSAAGRKQT